MPDQPPRAIDQTLRLARDAVERDIARYRVITFATVMVITGMLYASRLSPVWVPTAFFAVATLYAIGVRAYVSRRGFVRWVAMSSLVVDIWVSVGPFLIIETITPAQAAQDTTFAAYIVGPALMLAIFINSLRNSIPSAIFAGVAALATYLIAMPGIAGGFHAAEIPIVVMIVLASAIAAIAAMQARRALDDFARLELLRRYLPPEAVERVMREDPDQAIAPGGRQVTVTVLAADLRGFTSMSEKLAPSAVMAQLNAYHATMIDVIERHGGAIDKFIGDGTLVVFGLRAEAKRAAAQAVACARDMVGALERHNAERELAGSPPLAMGIGIHTGPVIAGNLGVPGRRLEFTVIGDTVNTASRLEGQTKGSGCTAIVSSATVDLLDSRDGLRELSPVSLRGREGAVKVWGF
jgi:adenylate cyclase